MVKVPPASGWNLCFFRRQPDPRSARLVLLLPQPAIGGDAFDF